MAEDATPPPIQSIIDRFERRARRQQWAALGFLGLMAAGIVAAILVFIFAKTITERETTTTDITARISSLNKLIEENRVMVTEKFNALNSALKHMLEELPTQTNENCKNKKSFIGPPDWKRIFFTDNGQLKPKSDSVNTLLSRVNPNADCLSIGMMPLMPYPIGSQQPPVPSEVILDIGQLKDVKAQNWSSPDPSSLWRDWDKLYHDGTNYKDAQAKLQEHLKQQEISPLIGEPDPEKNPPNLSLPFLLQLNITRFGTITLVVIALGILAPLYRFSARLANFYQTRADILRIHQINGYKRPGIERLSPVFTPTFDFRKSQAMPDHLKELITAALAHGKDTE